RAPRARAARGARAPAASNRAGRGSGGRTAETPRPRPPLDPPGDRGLLRRDRRRVRSLRPPPPRARVHAQARGGALSRLLLLRLGYDAAALLPDPGRLPGEPAQEVQLGATHPALANELDFRDRGRDRKSTRLNSSHVAISYAVLCP